MPPRTPTIEAIEAEPDLSAESAVEFEIRALEAWLAAQPALAGAVSCVPRARDGFYWRSGYRAGLQRALAMLSSRGKTLH